jgi:hypothetical protein
MVDPVVLGRILEERGAVLLQPAELHLDVCDEEVRRRYPLLKNLVLIRLRGRLVVEFQSQLHAFRFFRGNHGEPFVRARREFVFHLEVQNVGVEPEGLVLIAHDGAD